MYFLNLLVFGLLVNSIPLSGLGNSNQLVDVSQFSKLQQKSFDFTSFGTSEKLSNDQVIGGRRFRKRGYYQFNNPSVGSVQFPKKIGNIPLIKKAKKVDTSSTSSIKSSSEDKNDVSSIDKDYDFDSDSDSENDQRY